jgi:hypothetical protein
MIAVILKHFEKPDEVRTFELGRFEIVTLGGMTIGRAIYQPGWRWSTHVGAATGATHCTVEHVGLVLSGHATAAMADGTIHDLTAGTLFHTPADPPRQLGRGHRAVRVPPFPRSRQLRQAVAYDEDDWVAPIGFPRRSTLNCAGLRLGAVEPSLERSKWLDNYAGAASIIR